MSSTLSKRLEKLEQTIAVKQGGILSEITAQALTELTDQELDLLHAAVLKRDAGAEVEVTSELQAAHARFIQIQDATALRLTGRHFAAVEGDCRP